MPFQIYHDLEAEYNLPMADILLPRLNSGKEFDVVADELGVNSTTLWRWCKRAGIKRCYARVEDCVTDKVERNEMTA